MSFYKLISLHLVIKLKIDILAFMKLVMGSWYLAMPSQLHRNLTCSGGTYARAASWVS